jgi:hypothetical protein
VSARADELADAASGRADFAYLHDDAYARRMDRARRADDLVAEHGRGLHDRKHSLGCFPCQIAIETPDERDDREDRQ